MEGYDPLPADAAERRKVQNRNAQRKFRNRRHRNQVNQALQLHGTSPPAQPLSWPLLYDGQVLAESNQSPLSQQSRIPAPQCDISALNQQPQVSSQSAYGNGTTLTSANIPSQGNDPLFLNPSSDSETMLNDTMFLNSASDSESMAMSYLSCLDSVSPIFDRDVGPAISMATSAFPASSHDSSNPSTTISMADSRNIGLKTSDSTAQAPYTSSLPLPGSNPQNDFPANKNPQSKVPPAAPQRNPGSRASSPANPERDSNDSSSNNSNNSTSSNSSNHASPASSNSTESELTRHKDTMSALHIASHRGHTAILSILLTHQLDPNEPDGSGRPPLHLAAINGHTTATSLLLSHGARINATDSLGRTALHWTVLRGHEAVLKVFLDAGGADLNLRDRNDWSVLHVAVERGCEGILRMLLRHGADFKLKAKKCEVWKREEKEVEDESREESVVMEG